MCGVDVGALLCGTCVCFPSSVSARLCGARVLDDVRRGPGSAPAKPAAKSCLAGPKSALGSLICHAKKHHFVHKTFFTTEPYKIPFQELTSGFYVTFDGQFESLGDFN